MTKRELIIENICSSIKSDAIKNIFLNIFNENCDSIQLSAFEVIIWSAACEQLKSYEITDLNWRVLCILQNISYIDLLNNLNENISIKYRKTILKIKNSYKAGGTAFCLKKYRDIINKLFVYLSEDSRFKNYGNVKEIKNYKNLILDTSLGNLRVARKFGDNSFIVKNIFSNYPVSSSYDELISKEFYLNKENKYTKININCNTNNEFLKNLYSKFYEKYKGQSEYLYGIRFFIYFFSNECKKDNVINYKGLNFSFLKKCYLPFSILDEQLTKNIRDFRLVDYLIQFFRFSIETYREEFKCELFDDIYLQAIMSKGINRILKEGYELVYYNRFEKPPTDHKICIIPNEQTLSNSNSRNIHFMYFDNNKIPEEYREDCIDFIWYSDGYLKDKLDKRAYLEEFLNKLSDYKSRNINLKRIDKINKFIPDEFLYEYRSEIETRYDKLSSIKGVLKVVRKYLIYYKEKYEISDYTLKILTLRGLEEGGKSNVMTKKDISIIYKGFVDKESSTYYGRLYTLVFELFMISNLRIGEILNLKKDCLEEDKITKQTYITYISKTSNKEMIKKAISPEVKRIIHEAINISTYQYDDKLHDYIFVYPSLNKVKTGLKRINFYRHFNKVISDVKGSLDNKEYYPYNIRHTYMNNLCEEGAKNNLTVKQLEAISNDSFKTIKRYYEKKNNIVLMAEVMAGVTLSNVEVDGTIKKYENKGGRKVRKKLGVCNEKVCKFEIAECLICRYFTTFVNRIPRFEAEINECNKEIINTKNELIKKEKILEKEILAKYLVAMYRLKGGES